MNDINIVEEALHETGCNIVSGVILDTLATMSKKGIDVYLNVYTLYRNFVSCVEGDAETKIKMFKSVIKTRHIQDTFILDSKLLLEAILELGFNPIPYIPDYKEVRKRFKNIRELNDFKGVKFFIMSSESDASKMFKKEFSNVTINTTHKIPHSKDMSIVTHIGMDLLNYTKYDDVTLIESHTGTKKKKDLWYTKYFKISNNNLSIMPFNSLVYQLLGDSTMVKPQNIKLRKHIYKIAIEKHWYADMSVVATFSSIKSRDVILAMDIEKLKTKLYQ